MSAKKPINVRRKGILEQVQQDMGQHYRSDLVHAMQVAGDRLDYPNLSIRIAHDFGFCDGVKRAIEIAYATVRAFPGKRIWLIGEIIHNPLVNARLHAMGLLNLPWKWDEGVYNGLTGDDVVIIPAFGISVELRDYLDKKGVQLVDSTCGNVIKVWQRVRNYANRGITSVIHGKMRHEESVATASHSLGDDRKGRYIVIFSMEDAQTLANYIMGHGDKGEFMKRFSGSVSQGFDPDLHLGEIGMANQTTMLKDETAHIQRMLRAAVEVRDGSDARFHAFDTICSATQDRQNSLYKLLEDKPDTVFIIGGYNSSNTTHLAEIAAAQCPTYFVDSAECLLNLREIRCYNLATRREELVPLPPAAADLQHPWRVGITAGASCPANVIEQVIRRLAALRA